jgi:FKBP-type peptidyl-prolyl cis-trans isomerase SlyD
MAETKLAVTDDLVVSLDYTLCLDDEQEIANSADQAPLEFLQGQGQIIPGIERAIYGMVAGDEKDIVVTPDEGYGERDPQAFQLVPSETLSPDLSLEPGMGLRMQDEAGQIVAAFVSEIRPDGVLLDLNPPLAGQTLHFHVKISALRPATDQELAQGYVHASSSNSA